MSKRKKILTFSDLSNIFDLRSGVPVETIVTTGDINHFQASAMGLWNQSSFLVIKPYKTSKTLSRIKQTESFVINFVYDIRAFVVGALKKTLPNYTLEVFPLESTNVRLAEAVVWIKVKKLKMTDKDKYMEITLQILDGEVSSNRCYAWCRSDFMILEALIKKTRLPIYKGTEKEKILKNEIVMLSQECLRITSNAKKEKMLFEIILADLEV
ncbi:MAG: DUF447 domain-containing protein [Promethearchaeota archaeon]